MKLLLDENLSDRIVPRLVDLFPESVHVKAVGLAETEDDRIWSWAKQNDFTIVSKDSDFYQRSILRGHPPKFIYVQIGNCPTARVVELLRAHHDEIQSFFANDRESMLVLQI